MKTWITQFTKLCFLTCTLWATCANADTLWNNLSWLGCNTNGSWYITGGAGGTWYNVTQSNSVGTGPGWPNDNYSPNNTNGAGTLTFGVGYSFTQLQPGMLPVVSLGISYTYGLSTETDGQITQYNIPKFTNYNYSYNIKRQTLLGVAKLDLISGQYGTNYLPCCQAIIPYVIAGAGVSFNTASGYQEHHLSHVTPRISPGFNENTESYFAWIVGAGLDYVIQRNLWLSLDYYYGMYGYAKTGHGDNIETLTGTNYSHERLSNKISGNTVLLSFTAFMNFV